MKIKVEQRHIDAGMAGDPFCCPIALALAEIGFDTPHVQYSVIYQDGPKKRRRLQLPPKAMEFMLAFDTLGFWAANLPTLAPFEFELGDI